MHSRRGFFLSGAAMVAVLVTVAVIAAPSLARGVRAHASAAAQVPCSSIGGGKYDCQFYPAGNGLSGGAPVYASSGSLVGYLNQGTDFVYCQLSGETVHSGSDDNDWWAYTEANDDKDGWVNAVWASGGGNDGSYAGIPACASSDGLPPGGSSPPAATTTKTTTTPTVTVTTPAPTPTVTVTTPATTTTTPPPATSPSPSHGKRHLRVRIELVWRVIGGRTHITHVRFHRAPAKAKIRIQCATRRCAFSSRALTLKLAQKQLARVFPRSEVLRITITRAGYVPEVARLRFRAGHGPSGTIISR